MNEGRKATSPTEKKRARLRFGLKIAGGAALVLAAIGFAAPYAAVAYATKRATACFAAYEAPRPAAPPQCAPEIEGLITPSRLPWTRDVASYRGEELGARIALSDYRDAIIGMPSRQRLNETAEALERSQHVVEQGSRRLEFDDLGPAMGAPNLGRTADLLGDRETLIAHPERWWDWHVRLHTIGAALTFGDLPKAIAIAKRYAEFDIRDEDLRAALGVLLCMGDEPKRGMDLLTFLQDDRAGRRYAAMARNWGDVRTLLVACGAKAGMLPPPKPENPEAGQGVPVAPRALLRLRLAKTGATDAAEEREREGAIAGALRLLGEHAAGSEDPSDASVGAELRVGGTRAAILGAILASGYAIEPGQLIAAAQHSVTDGELPLLPSRAITALDWMRDPIVGGSVIAGATLESGAEKALALGEKTLGEKAPSGKTSGEKTPGEKTPDDKTPSAETSVTEGDAIKAIAGALFIEAARAYARAGDSAAALRAIDRGAPLALSTRSATALARSTAKYVTLDIEGALAELDADPDLAPAAAPALTDPAAKLVRAAALIQRAELLAAMRPKGDTRGEKAKAAAEAAIAADKAAVEAGDPALDARARWIRLALADAIEAPPLRPGTEVDIAPTLRAALASHTPLGPDNAPATTPYPHKGTGPDRAWAWVGAIPAGTPWTDPPPPGGPGLSKLLALWSVARKSPADERRALRYMLLHARADMAASPLAELDLASTLLGDQGETEIWIDAFTALDSRVMSHRSFAWMRVLAARWRGDAAAADKWKKAHDALVAIAADPARAELARFLGI